MYPLADLREIGLETGSCQGLAEVDAIIERLDLEARLVRGAQGPLRLLHLPSQLLDRPLVLRHVLAVLLLEDLPYKNLSRKRRFSLRNLSKRREIGPESAWEPCNQAKKASLGLDLGPSGMKCCMTRWSKSSPPRCVSPFVATTSKTPLSMVNSDTSKVPPASQYLSHMLVATYDLLIM